MHAIGYLVYGLDATFHRWGQSDCASAVEKALIESVKEDPAAFELNTDEVHALGFYDEDEGVDGGELRDILTESFQCWSVYSGSGATPVAIGVELHSFNATHNFPWVDLVRKTKPNLKVMGEFDALLDALPEAFAARLKEIKAQVFVIWGTS